MPRFSLAAVLVLAISDDALAAMPGEDVSGLSAALRQLDRTPAVEMALARLEPYLQHPRDAVRTVVVSTGSPYRPPTP